MRKDTRVARLRRRGFVLLAAAVVSWGSLGLLQTGFAQDGMAQEEILGKAETAAEQGRLDEALHECQEVLSHNPNSAHALYLLGVIDLEKGLNEEARKALVRSVAASPSRIASHIALGKAYLSLRNWKSAEEQFKAANDLGDTTGSGQFGLGLALLRDSRSSDALPHLSAAVRANPREPEWLFTLAGAELQVRQVSDARKHVMELGNLNPDDATLFFRLGKLLAEYKLPGDAEIEFHRAAVLIEKRANSPERDLQLAELDLQIARLRYDRHDYAGALERLNGIEPDPLAPRTQAEVLHLEGVSLVGQGKLNEGREKLRQAAGDAPSEPDYLFDWAWAELLAGNIQTAQAAVNRAMSSWPNSPNIFMLEAIVHRESTPERERIPLLADWHVKGEGMVCCPCDVPCPCRSNAPATHGHCESTGAYHITEGHYQKVSLKGLTFISVHACMGADSAPSVLFVEPSTTDDQVIALERIFQGLNPLRPFLFLSVKRTALSLVISHDGNAYEARVPGAVELKIRLLVDNNGKPLLQTAALDRFSNTLEYAKNLTYKIWDDDGRLKWDYSGRQANFRIIDLGASNYRDGTMLIQFADGSGFFTDQQLELIRELKLPTLRSYPRPTK